MAATSSVRSVAFGRDFEDYAIVYEGGDSSYSGVPTKVANILRSHKKATLLSIALGSDGEFWIQMSHRDWWNGGQEFLGVIKKLGSRVKFVDFGTDNAYFIRYT